ncbi:hypothetical protein G7Y89_g2332 [Cudoniella acicularis]|uniref:TauD/TfdA-like domain-containing protein n=1 Tax=Cudoniella acicularis TaxID=354080 RepID=A0A8H4W8Q5_9HELO|nr:hypothetical protein G7Y89_g2332 [Cudoniella acicularis]
MAPSVQQIPEAVPTVAPGKVVVPVHEKATYKRQIDVEGGTTTAKYPAYLPTWNPAQIYPPLEPYTHVEHGLAADPKFPDLLAEGTKVTKLTPTIGSEVTGVQLSKLSPAGKDQLALLVAQRKVVAFRNQDFADLPLQEALDFGGYFGRHHIHPTSGSPDGFPELHIVHRYGPPGSSEFDSFLANRNSSASWHSDVTYEAQPPGTTFLYLLDGPPDGGDTLFANQAEAYNRLSEPLKERLHGLKAVHSGFEQAQFGKERSGLVRREPVKNEHPIVRTHPITGEKALFINRGFTRSIVGLKKEESDALLNFLYDHISRGIDWQARVKWAPGTVVVWDNRVTVHSATLDWSTGERRHLARIQPQAEAPYETPYVKKE